MPVQRKYMAAALLVLATGLGVRFRAKKNNNVAARSAPNFPEAEGFDEEEAPVKLRGRRLLEFEKIPDAFDSADQISTTGNEDAIIVLRNLKEVKDENTTDVPELDHYFSSRSHGRALFLGEDFINGPFYHEVLSGKALEGAGFAGNAADDIGWHAEYIDSYLYSPIWWLQGVTTANPLLGRLTASLSIRPDLGKIHFDDLGTTDQVLNMWHRYMRGCLVGLYWAAEIDAGTYSENLDPIGAAHNLLGVTLHAIQDFYSHSNWIDEENRRERSFFDVAECDLKDMFLYTGSYENDASSLKPHGKISFICTVTEEDFIFGPIAKFIGDMYCGSKNDDICKEFKDCDNIKLKAVNNAKAFGLTIPANTLYYEPGIALDSKFLAEIAVKERGIDDQITATDAFNLVKDFAVKDAIEFLKQIESAMKEEGFGNFWSKLKTSVAAERKEDQYERFNHFPFQFIGAGALPGKNDNDYDNGYYLRVILKTADVLSAGTNADIKLIAGGKTFDLDYMPIADLGIKTLISYNDFEQGSEAVYTVGPFTELPSKITIKNDAPDLSDILQAHLNDVVQGFTDLGKAIYDAFVNQADYVGTRSFVMDPSYLDTIGVGSDKEKTLRVNGGSDGIYDVTFKVARQGETKFQVTVLRIKCIKESNEWSFSDEPFMFFRLDAYPGNMQAARTVVFTGVDEGESRDVDHPFNVVQFDTRGGMAITFTIWESDSESSAERNEAFENFKKGEKGEAQKKVNQYYTALGEAILQDWKLESIKVYAFSRGDSMKSGKVLYDQTARWIEGGKTQNFPIDGQGLKSRQGISINNTCEEPSNMPSFAPTGTIDPTFPPSEAPTFPPTSAWWPSLAPSMSKKQTVSPSVDKTPSPSPYMSKTPSLTPTVGTLQPSENPSLAPSMSKRETFPPSVNKTPSPSLYTSKTPSLTPSVGVSALPSLAPSVSEKQTFSPSVNNTPSTSPYMSKTPSLAPSISASALPSINKKGGKKEKEKKDKKKKKKKDKEKEGKGGKCAKGSIFCDDS